ncbi:YHYH protein [Aporhodopirellula aestuarii]|uniref:YHYH protein n=1 Tax=Aporhodopirellula aestuarii TaxID=2950107 RepID=A0ABT0TZE7_9BACT|nr:YHYH protein [Aporhodopirellula aestuarii]MCM2369866.1 YHYH protein [Aporhodopirellula aestuarii]
MKRSLIMPGLAALGVGVAAIAIAQQPPPPRLHTMTKRSVLKPVPATSTPNIKSEVSIEIVGRERIIRANGIPNHKTGVFPNRGNPNRITPQRHEYRVPADPQVADRITPMHGEFGVAINGVPFDPGAGEFYDGEPGWQYEPLSGAIALGIDVSHAHVQPTGKYHYHGLPTGLIDSVEVKAGEHSPLIGWAADGFPMYVVYGYQDPQNPASAVVKLKSSYQLKQGNRPGGNAPGGKYDGTFVRDYEYVAGSGDLDECNGRFAVTPEYPDGTYVYFLTEEWPVVPRCYRGTPSSDFRHGRGSSGPNPRDPGLSGAGERGGYGDQGRMRLGPPGAHPMPPTPGQVLPTFVREALNLTSQQISQLDALQATVNQRLDSILTEKQKEHMRQLGPPNGPPGGHPGFGGPGLGGPTPMRVDD